MFLPGDRSMDRMEKERYDLNWELAQCIEFSTDVVASAKNLRSLLTAVDQHPCLYIPHSPTVSAAIHRYERCWLPLLASSADGFAPGSAELFGRPLPLRPPLDCEWIWLCHRLNPVAYAWDCELLYGRLLGAPPYLNSPEVTQSTEIFWDKNFPHEPYSLDLNMFTDAHLPSASDIHESKMSYDLHTAVPRQSKFFYQVSETHMVDDSFLRAAEQRYKGFLHLFRVTNSKFFLVPTYDIDLIWHAHQLDPIAYAKDIMQILGKVLEHDDSDSDRTPGYKLEQGFAQTRKLWIETYGSVYERAGAMYRGEPPVAIPTLTSPQLRLPQVVETSVKDIPIARRDVMEVFLVVGAARNVPTKLKGKLSARLKMQSKASSFHLDTVAASLSSEVTWNQQWIFEVERSTEGIILELRLKRSIEQMLIHMSSRTMILGRIRFPWQKVLESPSLAYNGWVNLESDNGQTLEPSLFLSVSLTPPQVGPRLLRTINSIPTDDTGRMLSSAYKPAGRWLTRVVLDHANREVCIIRVRYSGGKILKYQPVRESEKCIYIHQGGWEYKDRTNRGTAAGNVVASAHQVVTGKETKNTLSMQRCWRFYENAAQLTVTRPRDSGQIWSPLLELSGALQNKVRLECGRKLQYQVNGASAEDEAGFVTLIRYDAINAPSGKATALFNWRIGAMEVSLNESAVLVVLLSTIISMSVFDMEGLDVDFHPFPEFPKRSTRSSDEWGSVVVRGNSGPSASTIPYYCWWDLTPMLWASMFYDDSNAVFGASTCGAAGACGSGGGGGGGSGGFASYGSGFGSYGGGFAGGGNRLTAATAGSGFGGGFVGG